MMRPLSLPSKRRCTSCSVLALATVLVVGATPAAAQFVGTIDTSTGIDTVNSTNSNLVITGNQAVINWTATNAPAAGQIAFLPDGTSATFTGANNFAVLNRVTPGTAGNAIYLGGLINSMVGNSVGGTVYFYSPNGIVVGANAMIDVGSLGLTTLAISDDGNGNWMTGFGTANAQVTFGPASNPNSYVRTNAVIDGSINALNEGSYVAMVAPRVEHHGQINVNGGAALVGAEGAIITFRPNGLFDIQVTTGTTDDYGVVSDGTITGPASSGAGDNHRAYLVAVPKNDALTMLIGNGSNLGFGFDVASYADVDGNTVVLSAGHDISAGSIGGVSAGTLVPGTVANLQATDGTYTSAVNAEATGYAHLSAFTAMHFFSDLNVHADGEIWLSTQDPAATLDIDGNLSLSTARWGISEESVATADISIYNGNVGGGGQLTVDGATTVNTSADGGWSGTSGTNAGSGTAGDVFITAAYGGTVKLLGGLSVTADGTGGGAFSAGVNGGDGTGGNVSVYTLGDDSHLTITGATAIDANGTGGAGNGGECLTCDGSGGNGLGGSILINADDAASVGSTLTFNGSVDAISNGTGGTAAGGLAGTGKGGSLTLSGGRLDTITIGGPLLMRADGQGGNHLNGDGGYGRGGTIVVRALPGGTVDLLGATSSFSSNAAGGIGFGNGDGGDADGWDIRIYADGLDSGLTISGATTASADASGGSSNGGVGGQGNGGDVQAFALNSGNLSFDSDLIVRADATGGAGATGGGDAFGGDVYIFSLASLQVDGALTASADATGGLLYFTDSNGFSAGDAFGGDVDVYAENGLLTLAGAVTLSTDATGGSASNPLDFGGDGTGGYTRLFANAGGTVDLKSTLDATAIGRGGGSGDYYSGGIGGDGQGGIGALGGVRVQANGANASITVAGAATLDASGYGSDDDGGDGTGGTVWADSFGAANASLNFLSDVTLYAQGFGGDGGGYYYGGGNGGNGQGGQALLQASAGSTVTVGGDATVNTDAHGGYSYNYSYSYDFSDSVGGNAIGGESRIQTFGGTGSGGTIDIDGNVFVSADGTGGGTGGFGGSGNAIGGDGTGGSAHLITTLGNITIGVAGEGGSVDVSADGRGGDSSSGTGGDGIGGGYGLTPQGGFARIEAINGDITIEGHATVSADGVGGDGQIGGDGIGSGDTSAPDSINWTGGAHIFARNGDIAINGGADVSASGTGGDGSSGGYYYGGYGSPGGDGGDGTGGWATIHAANSAAGASSIEIIGGIYEGSGYASVVADGTGGSGGNGYQGDYGDWGIDGTTDTIGTDGGDGTSGGAGGAGGRGGDGTGGIAIITAASDNGHVSITSASASAVAVGGDGGDGGDGGYGGYGGNGGNGLDGPGGNGGDGGNGGAGGLGGVGGAAVGGITNVGTESGNGSAFGLGLGDATYGNITLNASATGGWGGNGGANGTAGSGGAGGTGSPGGVAGNQGSQGAAGNGGDGGDATGGAAVLLVRGSLVTVDSTTLTADATGGHAGFGYVPEVGTPGITGIGGDATVGGDGGIGVVVTSRYLNPSQRGTLDAGTINGTAIATAGIGIPNGNTQTLGGSTVTFLNADGTIGSLDFLIQTGDNDLGTGLVPDSISIINGNVEISSIIDDVVVPGEFSFITSGNLSLFANNGDMHSGNLTLSAGDFVFDSANDPAPDPGTYFADSATITTGNNFVTTAHLDIGSNLVIDAPGLIDAANFTIDGDLDLIAQGGGITANNLDVTGAIDLDAFGAIDLNLVQAGFFHADAGTFFTSSDITSDTNIQINAGDDVTLGEVVAGPTADINSNKAIRIITDGSVLAGNILSIGGIDITASGSITGGNVTTGDVMFADALGAIVFGNVSAGLVNPQVPTAPFSVGLASGASITVGNIDALLSIALVTPGTVTSGNLTTAGDVLGLVDGNMSIGGINSGGRVLLADYSMYTDAGGTIPTNDGFNPELVFGAMPVASGGSITVNGPISADSLEAAAGTSFSSGNIVSNGLISVTAGTSIGTGSILNTADTFLTAGTSINVGAIDSGPGSVMLITDTSFISGDVIDAGSIYVTSGSSILLSDLTTPDQVEMIAATDIAIGNVTAGQTIDINAGGDIDGGDIIAGDSIYVDAGGSIALNNVSAGIINHSNGLDTDFDIGIIAGTTLVTGNIEAFYRIGLGAQGNINTGNINAGDIFMALGGGNMSFGSIEAGGPTYLANSSMIPLGGPTADEFDPTPILAATPVASGGSILINGPVTTSNFQAAAGTTLTGSAISSANLLYATSGGNMALGNLDAGNDVQLTSGGNIVTGSIISGDDVALIAAGSISTLDIFAYDDVSADAGTTITTDDITGSTIDLLADGDITTGDLLTQNFFQGVFQLVEGASITVQSGGDVDTGTIDSIDGVHVDAAGGISTGTIDAETFVELFAGGNITAGTINAGSYIDIFSDTGLLALDDLHAVTQIDLESDGSLQFGDATADDFNFEMGGSVNGGNIDAITHADGHAEGAVVLENITVTGPPSENDFSIGITSTTSIEVENVDGFDQVGFATLGDLTTGNLTAGSLVMTLAGGDIATGSITTDEGGQVYMADASMFETGGGLEEDGDFDESIVLALSPVPTGGSILIDGPVTTGLFRAAAEGNFTAHAIVADSLDVYSEGTATIDGMWNVPDVTLVSNDIDITANGGIDGGSAGQVTLNSIHAEGALIGDGLTGSGYALSDAEFGRISGGSIAIVAGGYAGAGGDMRIGDLAITGPLAGSNIESNGGGVEFATLNESGNELDGTLRVVGEVVATGFGPDNYLGFYTQNFELDAATGLISITGNGDVLAGTLEIYASRIHVAEGSLLDQLADNPQFAGYREALNQQAAVQRPDGVIRAANFAIEFGGSDHSGPYTLFVQNMGTTTVPAGFLLNAANIADDGEGEVAPGSIDMAINGQIISQGGTLTGVDVRDLLVEEFGTEPFVAGSTINGCPLVGACNDAPPPPTPPRVDTPTRTDVQLTDNSGLGDGLFGNEGDIDDGLIGDEGDRSNPIAAPNPLFDSRPLGATDDVDDPVSGAGNPSLYGANSDESVDVEICDSTKDKKCKADAKGDGK